MTTPAEVFARTVIAFEPYASDVVFVGGWVHAIYLAELGAGGRPLVTTDVDVSLPNQLEAAGRTTLRDLALNAGFFPNWLSTLDGQAEHLVYEIPHSRAPSQVIDLDLLTEAPIPQTAVPIVGQTGLLAQGYPGQRLLQEESMWMKVGSTVHPLLDPPRSIRVPMLGAYVLHKGVASTRRAVVEKATKDLVYIYEIAKDPVLRSVATGGVQALKSRYPSEFEIWHSRLTAATAQPALRRGVAGQIAATGTVEGSDVVEARVTAQFQRLLADVGN